MQWEKNKCSECGELAVGILEKVDGFARLKPDNEGGFDYAGETDMLWDTQDCIVVSGCNILKCANGHTWESHPVNENGKTLPVNNRENRKKLAKAVVDAADPDDTLEMATQGCLDLYERDDEKFLQDWENFFFVEELDDKQTENKTESEK